MFSPPGRSETVKQWFKWLLENQHLFDRYVDTAYFYMHVGAYALMHAYTDTHTQHTCMHIHTHSLLYCRECGGHSYGELLLLTAIHFHDNKRTQIEQLISDTIGLEIKASIFLINKHTLLSFQQNVPRTGDFGEIRDLFLQVFSEKVSL